MSENEFSVWLFFTDGSHFSEWRWRSRAELSVRGSDHSQGGRSGLSFMRFHHSGLVRFGIVTKKEVRSMTGLRREACDDVEQMTDSEREAARRQWLEDQRELGKEIAKRKETEERWGNMTALFVIVLVLLAAALR